jgi:hypothetical protein
MFDVIVKFSLTISAFEKSFIASIAKDSGVTPQDFINKLEN